MPELYARQHERAAEAGEAETGMGPAAAQEHERQERADRRNRGEQREREPCDTPEIAVWAHQRGGSRRRHLLAFLC
jgi:hypothetical protein